ncbi:hypothetical protein [Aurantiacibacter zhengii]|uniref:hypothetical protein n=1 Tax=Aurantiacibacter zhengii TaxID=2307003 RepID=UPI001F4798F5|nr:hypothetical protein [Aurantiacibacter zhengii]
MDEFFASGHAVDVVLAVVALEFLWLAFRHGRAVDAALMLLPAAFILLGLRAALTGAPWYWVAIPLTLAFPAHLADLVRRMRR